MAKLNRIASLFLLLALGGCDSDRRVADSGTGSETTNHIAGVILADGNAVSARTQVILVRSDFDPVSDALSPSMVDTTDSKGRFEFGNPGAGNFRLEAAGLDNGLLGLKEEFHYSSGEQKVPDLVLGKPGFVAVTLPESLRAVGSYIFIPGTTYLVSVGEHRRSVLGPLPAMRIAELAYARSVGSARVTLARDVALRPGDTLDFRLDSADTAAPADSAKIPPVDSARAWRLRLNTTGAGAGVSQDVIGFPMLVRLDSGVFDFSLVRDGGAGIGFFKPDSTPLPFEIERWDSTARKAEIWVRMDTVQGATDTQTVWMRKAKAGSPGIGTYEGTPGSDVFRSQNGFAGVWHLGTASGDRPDATGNGHWARPVNFDGDENVEGVVGRADSLDARNDLLDVGLVNVEEALTLSAWIRPNRTGEWAPIIQKPTRASPDRSLYSYALWEWNGGQPNLSMGVSDGGHGPVSAGTGTLSDWALVHATYNGTTFTLYCNGNPVATRVEQYSMAMEMNNLSTLIGSYSNTLGYKYSGVVDEVRIERAVRGPSWVRLSYQNQKAGQTLVRIVP